MRITSDKLKKLALCIIVTSFLGCQIWKDKTVPEELVGVWETSAPRYKNCFFELKGEMITFNKGLDYINVNLITDIEKSPEQEGILYDIHYEDEEGQEYKLSLFYFKTPDGGVIRFKNQKEIKWTRREDKISLRSKSGRNKVEWIIIEHS